MTAIITVIGSLNMDMVTRTRRFPAPGETLIGQNFQTVPGGKGANQAVAAARLGAQVAMVGRVGNDDFGRALLRNLEEAKVNTSQVHQCQEPNTGTATILVDDAGENCIVVVSGANHQLTPQDITGAEAVISGSDMVLLQLETPIDTINKAAELARKHGVKVVLNPAPAQPLPPSLLSLVDILVPNETETALLAGMPVGDDEQAIAAAAALLEMGVGVVVLTLGARGAMVLQGTRGERIPAFAVTPVDTTAAGDAFTAGLAVAMAEGLPLAEAARWGNAAGALATTVLGAQPSLPTREAVEKLLEDGKPSVR